MNDWFFSAARQSMPFSWRVLLFHASKLRGLHGCRGPRLRNRSHNITLEVVASVDCQQGFAGFEGLLDGAMTSSASRLMGEIVSHSGDGDELAWN